MMWTEIIAELDHDNNAIIPQQNLKALREKSSKAEVLEDEVSSLTKQNRILEARMSEASLLTEKNAETRRLIEDNARLTEELKRCKSVSSGADGVEKEDKRLMAELQPVLERFRDGKKAGGSLRTTPIHPANKSSSSASRSDAHGSEFEMKEKYETLARKFNRLYENHQDISLARKKLVKARINDKAKAREHVEFLDKIIREKDVVIQQQNDELQRLGSKFQSINGESLRSTSRSLKVEQGGERDVSGPSSMQNDRASPSKLPMVVAGRKLGRDQSLFNEYCAAMEPYTSTTSDINLHTSLEEHSVPVVNAESSIDAQPSPGTPIVVYSRSLRKARNGQETTDLKKAPRVKIETLSSSPIGLAALLTLDDGLDLDDIGDKQSTPRKGRPFLQQAPKISSSISNAAWNEARAAEHCEPKALSKSQVSQVTPIRLNVAKRSGSVLQPRSPNTRILPRTSTERAQKRRKVSSDYAVNELLEDGHVLSSIEKSPKKKNTPISDQTHLLPDLLAKPCPPMHILGSVRLSVSQSKSSHVGGSSAGSSLAYEIPQFDTSATIDPGPLLSKGLARSKEMSLSARPTIKERAQSPRRTLRPSSRCSLEGSAEPLTPASRSRFRDSAYQSRPTSRDSPETRPAPFMHSRPSLKVPLPLQRPTSIDLVMGSLDAQCQSSKGLRGQPNSFSSVLKTAQTHATEQTGSPSGSRNQPLRDRLLDELTLQDFKVNPKSNQGYGYAFREVVRKQADRRCLPGCTKLDCCGGQFRALAEATRDRDKTPTASQQEADEKIIKDFLGDNSHKAQNMTEAERHETLIRALARDMSNKMGKHRHAYERRQSPPGYWRSDFPDTQEQIQDREKARELEREQLLHRYEEAMRGGVYLFRDE